MTIHLHLIQFLLAQHLKSLLEGNTIQKPVYNFAEHNRATETVALESKDIIILEGILILEDKALRDLMDIKIFVDTDADVRIIRRITRDINDRGRTLESVINQYLKLLNLHMSKFIEPTKKFADIIIPEGGFNKVAVDVMVSTIKKQAY